ncbi:hypothetical protein CERSUDRAFT_96176 [Gelatoporia subvermispora B]|uniref:F-box domain-containing protein n=1 Tax=Ceriporiopsis subvermispora (strain B) TaxID=914234 RepID=M2QV62_CERS8|nr:hypothetical protein CERSUDRAFT_96176 [Gelatoporia subvermispora B]
MSILAPKELVAIMRTCSTLHSAGVKHLLNLPIKLSRAQDLQVFCQFVLQDTPRRAKFLRTIYLEHGACDWATIDLLIQVLSDASGLQKLEIDTEAEMLMVNPSLVQSPHVVRSLRSLTLSDCYENDIDILRSLESPIEQLKLIFASEVRITDSSPPLLANFCGTFQTLCIHGYYALESEPPIVLHCVRTLEMSFFCASYDTRSLCAMFPNVVHMKFCDDSWEMDTVNLEGRFVHNQGYDLDQQWTHLHSLHGLARAIHAACLRCESDDLDVEVGIEDLHKFIQMMSHLRPRRLNITVDLIERFDFMWDYIPEPLDTIFDLVRSWSDVEDVKLTMRVDKVDMMETFLDAFANIPDRSRIEQLEIDVEYEEGTQCDEEDLNDLAGSFKEIDVPKHVARISRALPALRKITVFVPCNSRSVWLVDRLGSRAIATRQSWEEDPGDWYDEHFYDNRNLNIDFDGNGYEI